MEEISCRIYRYDPEIDKKGYWASYRVTRQPQMTVLDVLFKIQGEQDLSLAFRCACRVGMCGTCGVTVNGRPRLACSTSIDEAGTELDIAPMRSMLPIKDLAVDMAPFFESYQAIIPYFVPRDPDAPPAAIPPGSEERGIIDESLECITCGLCYAGCGVVASTKGRYLGPAALNRAYNLIQDSRDAAGSERLAIIGSEDGVWRCHVQFACADVCPKHINPAHTIQQLRRKSVGRRLRKLFGLGK